MSNATNPTPALPNPFTPLAFLPEDLANQFEISRYIYAITLGAFMWDICVNLGVDYRLLFKSKVRFPTAVYFFSRIFTLSYIITSFIFQVGDVGDCQKLQVGLGICFVLGESTTALLFFLRVRAVWLKNKIVQAVFFFLWLCFTASTVTIPLGISGAHIGPTMKCINTRVAGYVEAVLIVQLINDTAILVAVSYCILSYTVAEDNYKAHATAFFSGRGLSRLSQSLLQGGQHYYFVAVCANIVLYVMVKDPKVPPVYHGMMSIPVLAIINLMACIVFRKIRFGIITADGTTTVGGDVSSMKATVRGNHGPTAQYPKTYVSSKTHIGDNDPYALSNPGKPDGSVDGKSNDEYPLQVRVMTESQRSAV